MSKNPRFENAIDELNYYKKLTTVTAECIINNSGTIIEQAEKVKYCGTHISTAMFDGRQKIIGANFCRLRLCPMCQRRKSLKTYADISRLVEALPGRTWAHVVLTYRNCTAEKLKQNIDSLFKNSTFLLRRTSEMKAAFRGALRCLEVTYNSTSDTYHPHLHILLTGDKSLNNNIRKRISRKQLCELWQRVSCLDYRPEVYISYKVDSGAVAEIAKYCVKPLELDLEADKRREVLEVLYSVLYGRRLIQTYGEIKKTLAELKIDLNSDVENLETSADSFNTEQMFVYNFKLSKYEEANSVNNFLKVK